MEVMAQSVAARPFHAFISHAHADQFRVSEIREWLRQSGIPCWYDGEQLHASSQIATAIANAIPNCRAMVLMLSKAAVESGWVKEEYELAMEQRTSLPDFHIVPVLLEDCVIPGFLRTTLYVDARSQFGGREAADLVAGLYGLPRVPDWDQVRDVYASRTWRQSESAAADRVVKLVTEAGFRLIGDATDHQGYLGGMRVEPIIKSCGALVAVVPHRGNGQTSPYILSELEIALHARLPTCIVVEPGVELPVQFGTPTVMLPPDTAQVTAAALAPLIEDLQERWRPPPNPAHFFIATDLDSSGEERRRATRDIIERVTATRCIFGDQVHDAHLQDAIVRMVRDATVVIADISDDNLSVCIEAGVALGAARHLHVLSKGPRRTPPFFFRDREVSFYSNTAEFLAIIHRIAYGYRRRVLS